MITGQESLDCAARGYTGLETSAYDGQAAEASTQGCCQSTGLTMA